jgi:hypothetical protein
MLDSLYWVKHFDFVACADEVLVGDANVPAPDKGAAKRLHRTKKNSGNPAKTRRIHLPKSLG